MDATFVPIPFADIADTVREHLAALPSAIDSYLEDHILASDHYRIVVAGEAAGIASIHGERLITQFALAASHRQFGQPLFAQLRRLEQAHAALVPTCDEFYLAHALDDHRQLTKQAYFFTAADTAETTAPDAYALRPAEPDDATFIREESGDFFDRLDRHIAARELFVILRQAAPVGFGIIARSTLYDAVASIGMYTLAPFRRGGVGTATIALLRRECRRQGIRPIAGCAYYNHRSKQTLERAGLHSPTRLLKIDY